MTGFVAGEGVAVGGPNLAKVLDGITRDVSDVATGDRVNDDAGVVSPPTLGLLVVTFGNENGVECSPVDELSDSVCCNG